MKRNYCIKIKIILCMLIILSVFLYKGVKAYANEPGGADDPLITKSFVESFVGELKNEIDELKIKINELNQNNSQNSTCNFKTVYIESGNAIYLDEGTEVILRSGKSIAISDNKQGFTDVTSGIDTFDNGNVIKNHLIISPRKDNRYLKVIMNSYFMIKGNYVLKKLQ